MNQPKPQWNLAFFIVPLIIASLELLHFFPSYVFPLLLIACVLSIGKKVITAIYPRVVVTHAPFEKEGSSSLRQHEEAGGFVSLDPPTTLKGFRYIWSHIKRFITLFNLIFLFGIGLMALIFLSATTQLEPHEIGFENIANLWKLIFPLAIGLVIAHVIVQTRTLSSQRKLGSSKTMLDASLRWHDKVTTKTHLTTQILLNFSSFVAILIGLTVAIFSIASAITRSLGADVFTGLQLQTMLASTVLIAPYLSKRWTQRWKKRQPTKSYSKRRFKILSSSLLLILLIIMLSLITMPLISDKTINISLISYLIQPGKTFLYWKLLMIAWGVAFAPLLAEQIDLPLSRSRSMRRGEGVSVHLDPADKPGDVISKGPQPQFPPLISLVLATGCVYWLGAAFLDTGGKDYFLTIIRQGIPALILTALFLFGLTLKSTKFLKNTYIQSTHIRKQNKDAQSLTQALTQGLAFACVLYWTTSFAVLFPLLLMLVIPSILMFLLL